MFKVVQLYIEQNIPKQTKGEVSHSQESVSAFFLLNHAALNNNCFAINGCYGYKNGGCRKEKFFFFYNGKLCVSNRGYL